MMKLAIMQPYFFPYIGYFQLVNAVDKFVFYDDVNFIKRGWINRNRILLNYKDHTITIALIGASQNRLINEIEVSGKTDKLKKITINAYKKAPYFHNLTSLIELVLKHPAKNIGDLAAFSVVQTCEYLGISTRFEFSSKHYANTINLRKEKRLIEICKLNKADEYINPIGGTELYKKAEFAEHGIKLRFLKTNPIQYRQSGESFIPNLSIIDVMMFNDKPLIQNMLNDYKLL